jgi:predicted ATP-dependent protease
MSNRRNLMLRDDLVEAVRAGTFHVWPVAHVDEAIELLTGESAEGVHAAVADRVAQYARLLQPAPDKAHEAAV